MHKLMAIALIVYSYISIRSNMPRLPERIPTHFNWAGEPTGWSSPGQLWLLLGAQIFSVVILLAIPALGRRFPQMVNLGRRRLSDLSPEQRERVMPLLEGMCGYMGALMSFLFSFLIRDIIRVALAPGARPYLWAVGAFFAAFAALVIYYLWRINSEAATSPPGRR